jgi:signal transduction histidine kinase
MTRAFDGQPAVLELPEVQSHPLPRRVAALAAIPARVAAVSLTSHSRLARELHDGVGQSITALLVEIRVALDRGEAGRDDLLVMEREAANALQAVRWLAYGVRQRALSDQLGDARRYGDRLLAATGGVLRWIDERSNPRLAHRVSKQLAWSIRESITNAVRHGDAGLVEVRLSESAGRVRVTVRDDGIGFLPEEAHPTPDGRGLGLLGNAERMAEVGGLFNVRSRPGEGAVVVLEAPRYLRRMIVARSPALQLALDSLAEPKAAAGAV